MVDVYATGDAECLEPVGSDPSIQAGSGLRCGRYRGPPCSKPCRLTPLASYTRSLKTVKLFLANEAHYVGDTACALAVPKHEVVSLRYLVDDLPSVEVGRSGGM